MGGRAYGMERHLAMPSRTKPWTVPLVVGTLTLSGAGSVTPRPTADPKPTSSPGRYQSACYCNSYSSRSHPRKGDVSVKVPFTWKVTGWFMIGWSAEFPVGDVQGAEVLRRGPGRPTATNPAICTSWRRTASTSAPTSGTAARSSATASSARSTAGAGVPTAPTATSPTSRTGPTAGCSCASTPSRNSTTACSSGITLLGLEPQWEMPDIFRSFPQYETDPNAYYRPYPEFSRLAEDEPGTPSDRRGERSRQRTLPVRPPRHRDPEAAGLGTSSTRSGASSPAGPMRRSDDPDQMALRIHSHMFGLGGAISVFEGQSNHRLIFACTPVDDEVSEHVLLDLGTTGARRESDVPPEPSASAIEKQFLGTVWDDLRHLALPEVRRASGAVRVDAKPYMALRKWATQFYDASPTAARHLAAPVAAHEARAQRARRARRHTAIVTQECQGAVMGPNAGLAVLAAEARREALPNIVAAAARGPRRRRADRALPGAAQAGRPRRQPQRAAVRGRRQGSRHHPRAARERRCCPNSALHQPISCCTAGTVSARWAAPTSTRSCAISASRPSSRSAYR